MIRSTFVSKLNRSVAGSLINNWDCTVKLMNGNALYPHAVIRNPERFFSVEGGSDDKSKTNPPGFVAPGSLGNNPENTTQKDVTTSAVQSPPVAVVTSGGKLGRADPVDPIARSKATEDCSSKEDNQSEAEKRAMEAKEAAAKQIQDIMANMPSKQQTEKYFFRVVAFIYDLSYLTCTWLVHFIEQNIVRNAKVQHYWKRFHEKMEEAKKD
ncbi:uncharacterized protein LOC108093146 [Drosophila ficusphila]|uniref:uncharacterized protein LOC108093146 n=1 Tax=Drosophila ficusphila TaxID=30025 RepID=UPI0007E87C2F|nr:uncharacterized protein LOC108093146 [Drosophila ficusphila]